MVDDADDDADDEEDDDEDDVLVREAVAMSLAQGHRSP